MSAAPSRGAVHWADFSPQVGDEIWARRPALVLSNDIVHRSRRRLAIVVPGTTTPSGSRLHPSLVLRAGDRERTTYFLPEQVKSVSHDRFGGLIARAPRDVLDEVARIVRLLVSDH